MDQKLENYEKDEETRERVCESITRALVRRNHEKHTMLADLGEERESKMAYAAMTSPARSCRGMQCVKHGNLN